MPLDVVRLLDSDLFALSSGDEFKAAVALWCKAWSQLPAGSLPGDDRVLAHLSSAGPRWAKMRDMALRGWVLCSDGRYYHPVVSRKANEAWALKQAQRQRTDAARRAKLDKAQQRRGGSDRSGSSSVTEPVAAPLADSVTENETETVTTPVAQTVTGSTIPYPSSLRSEEDPPPSLRSAPPARAKADRSEKGTRLPPDWQPGPESRDYAAHLGLDPDRIAEDFRDYWHTTTKNPCRTGWPRVWQKWCRTEADKRGRFPGFSGQSRPVERPMPLSKYTLQRQRLGISNADIAAERAARQASGGLIDARPN